jgi:hypothetical protein
LTVAAAVVVSLVAISSRSLWIDEACTAVRATQPTLASWWQAMAQAKTGCLQMPLYMLYTWGWTKVFGASEWSFHLANLPWFVTGAAALILSFPAGDRRRPIAACLVLVSPFAWYYLDEARPYAMQLGASLLIMASLRHLARGDSLAEAEQAFHVTLFVLAMIVLCGSSLFGMIWGAAAVAVLLVLLPRAQLTSVLRRHRGAWLVAAVPLGGFAVYYAWTLTAGARGSAAATTTLASILFNGYELLGFAGLGPGRLEMRTSGVAGLREYWLPVALYGAAVAIVVGAAVWHGLRHWNRRHLAIALFCCMPAAFILGVGLLVHFRALGRHLTPSVAPLLLLFILGASALWPLPSGWARMVVVCFCGLSLISCLSLRFSARHEKDNYRAAAAVARTALREGRQVWWNAAEEGAQYYQVPLATGAAAGHEALYVVNPSPNSLRTLPPPEFIVASKSDVYDRQMALADYIREQGYFPTEKFAAFVVWERKRH